MRVSNGCGAGTSLAEAFGWCFPGQVWPVGVLAGSIMTRWGVLRGALYKFCLGSRAKVMGRSVAIGVPCLRFIQAVGYMLCEASGAILREFA